MHILGNIYYTTSRIAGKSQSAAPRGTPFAGAGRAARRALTALRNWRARRAAVQELEALPERLLRDIGLERADIDAAVAVQLGKLDSRSLAGLTGAGGPARPFAAAACP